MRYQVDCKWSSYGNWSECSATCGGGSRSSSRAVLQPALDGGKDCVGDAHQIEKCNSDPCPGTFKPLAFCKMRAIEKSTEITLLKITIRK